MATPPLFYARRSTSTLSKDFYPFYPRSAGYITANAYRADASPAGLVREPSSPPLDDPTFSERHLHCIWFDPRFRPLQLTANNGEPLVVEHPGSWNLEAGPDFIGTVIHAGQERRRIVGDAEIHIRAGDWKQHGHTGDPNFANVKFHITYYPGAVPATELPPGTIQLALEPQLVSSPDFSFEQIDVTAYPYEIDGPLSPLKGEMGGLSPEDKRQFLDIAGEERLRRKTKIMADLIARKGPEQALYEEVMAALGYKHNKVAFRKLAQCLPLDELRNEAQGNPSVAYALLLGVSGLMPEQADGGTDQETRELVRQAWDIWWKRAEKWEQRIMQKEQWTTAHLRPANHPLRRMMAAAHLFTLDDVLPDMLKALPANTSKQWCQHALSLLEINTQTFWTRRLSLKKTVEGKPVALIGRARAINILTNTFVPFSAAMDRQDLFSKGLLDALPCEAMNSITRETAHAIFGQDHSSSLYRTGLRRQGLIQIFYDYGIGRKRPGT